MLDTVVMSVMMFVLVWCLDQQFGPHNTKHKHPNQSPSAINCPIWSSVYECQRVECAFTSPVRTECGMFMMYCMQCCMSVSAVL